MCVCVSERERERERECVCERERERESVCVCVCVCVCEREREKERERESASLCVYQPSKQHDVVSGQCQDTADNCQGYGASVCTTYADWARANCQKMCNLCGARRRRE